MSKKALFTAMISMYELIRALFFVCAKPEGSADMLPLFWYSAVPFLVFPLLLTFFLYKENETSKNMAKLYALAKIMSVISLAAYLAANTLNMVVIGVVSPKKLVVYILVLLFLFIDGILAIIQAVPKTKLPE